jgi:iron(III) transport system substrate-binding protein
MRKLIPLAALFALSALLLMGQGSSKIIGLEQNLNDSQLRGATSEGHLVLYTNFDNSVLQNELLSEFTKKYPFISLDVQRAESHALHDRFVREIDAGKPSADLVWTSAMDLQEKLINDGYTQPYFSKEQAALPQWAKWKGLGYGTTSEPIAIVYNKDFINGSRIPRSHTDLTKLLSSDQRLKGKVAAYDIEKSEAGMLFAVQDASATPASWDLLRQIGKADATLYSTSADILANVASGDQWIGYNVISSDALRWQKTHPQIGIVFPSDYFLTMTRVIVLSEKARHPNAAKLFIDFILSKSAQSELAKNGFGSVRTDLSTSLPSGALHLRAQAIRLGPGLLVGLDQLKRSEFARKWQKLQSGPSIAHIQSAQLH